MLKIYSNITERCGRYVLSLQRLKFIEKILKGVVIVWRNPENVPNAEVIVKSKLKLINWKPQNCEMSIEFLNDVSGTVSGNKGPY